MIKKALTAAFGMVLATGCSQGNSIGPQVANVIHQQTIIGTWSTDDGKEYIKFFTNGSCSVNGLTGWRDGTYELVDGQRLNLTVPGFVWGDHKLNLDYDLSGDRLDIKYSAFGAEETKRLKRD